MLLTLDVGNTNTVLGLYRDIKLVAHWRLTTARDQTVDEYGILTRELLLWRKLTGRGHRRDHQFGGAATQSHAGRNVGEVFSRESAVHRAGSENRHAGAV